MQPLPGALPWPGEQAEQQAPRGGTPTPKTAPVQPGVAGQPEGWWRIYYDHSEAGRWGECLADPDGPRAEMHLADLQGRAYRMQDVTEQGQVVQTAIVEGLSSSALSALTGELPPLEGHRTWYRGYDRCARALERFRAEAQQELQRRERYR
jgi:hypothetical protein